MTTEEIRDMAKRATVKDGPLPAFDTYIMTCEIAAQLAELNANLTAVAKKLGEQSYFDRIFRSLR